MTETGFEWADGEPLPVAFRLPNRFDRRTLYYQHGLLLGTSKSTPGGGPGLLRTVGGKRYLE
jgi:hypothetical protein